MTYNFKSIVMTGCGQKCIGFMGCLYQLEKNNLLNLNNIDTYVGVSSGSMLSYMLIIGYTPLELLQKLTRDNIFKQLYQTVNYSNIFNGNGIFNYNIINEYIQTLTFEKTNRYTITFRDIREMFNKRYVVCTYNETDSKTIYFDSANQKYDDVSCLVAIRCSSNIPYIFSDFIYKDCEYIDGGICDIFPIHIADNKLHDVLALITNFHSKSKVITKNQHFLQKLFNRISIPINLLLSRRLEYISPKVKYIDVDLSEYQLCDFNIDSKIIMDMFNIGMNAANNAPDVWKKSRPKVD